MSNDKHKKPFYMHWFAQYVSLSFFLFHQDAYVTHCDLVPIFCLTKHDWRSVIISKKCPNIRPFIYLCKYIGTNITTKYVYQKNKNVWDLFVKNCPVCVCNAIMVLPCWNLVHLLILQSIHLSCCKIGRQFLTPFCNQSPTSYHHTQHISLLLVKMVRREIY